MCMLGATLWNDIWKSRQQQEKNSKLPRQFWKTRRIINKCVWKDDFLYSVDCGYVNCVICFYIFIIIHIFKWIINIIIEYIFFFCYFSHISADIVFMIGFCRAIFFQIFFLLLFGSHLSFTNTIHVLYRYNSQIKREIFLNVLLHHGAEQIHKWKYVISCFVHWVNMCLKPSITKYSLKIINYLMKWQRLSNFIIFLLSTVYV